MRLPRTRGGVPAASSGFRTTHNIGANQKTSLKRGHTVVLVWCGAAGNCRSEEAFTRRERMTMEHEIIIGRSGTGMSMSPQFLQSLLLSLSEDKGHLLVFDIGKSSEEITAELPGKEDLS
jgi:hypothetical protein